MYKKTIKLFLAALLITLTIISCKTNTQQQNETITPLIQLPRTGQFQCFDNRGNVIPCTGTGQDGELQRGVKWPKPRFIVHSNGTVIDRLTGLMWERKPSLKRVNWYDAFKRIDGLNKQKLGGYTDWRMPNINELISLINFGEGDQAIWLNSQGFNSIQKKFSLYWSGSTCFSTIDSNSNKNAYCLLMRDGIVSGNEKLSNHDIVGPFTFNFFVIAVRTHTQGRISLPQTGQTMRYHPGDDGALKIGVPLPKKRFLIIGNKTVTDRLTGLIWELSPDKKLYNWDEAYKRIAYLNSIKLGGYNDWRLPNILELKSLIMSSINHRKYMMRQGFKNIKNNNFISSSNEVFYNKNVWYINIAHVGVNSNNKNYKGHCVIAVRGGS